MNDRPLTTAMEQMPQDSTLYKKIMRRFPHPMHIASPDGTLLDVNDAFLEFFRITDRESFVKYNQLQEPNLEKWGIKEHLTRAFRGETVQLHDVKVPVHDLVQRYSDGDLAFHDIYLNILSFPIHDDEHRLSCVATVFMTSRVYRGDQAVVRGQEYLETHWQDKFDIDKVAQYAHLSKYHFARMFKKHTGMTPSLYHRDIRLRKLKERLRDRNRTVAEAFADCGLDYNGYSAKVFRAKVGMTPSQYRASIQP